jgi:hypothetical protein
LAIFNPHVIDWDRIKRRSASRLASRQAKASAVPGALDLGLSAGLVGRDSVPSGEGHSLVRALIGQRAHLVADSQETDGAAIFQDDA